MQTVGQNGYVMRDPYAVSGTDTWNRDGAAQAAQAVQAAQTAQAAQPQQQTQQHQPTIPGGVITVQTPPVTQNVQQMPDLPADERLRHGLSEQVIGNPISVEEAYLGSMQALLTREIGSYIIATFLVGTGQMLRAEGRLVEVGNDYIVIRQDENERYVVGDLNSLRFAEFTDKDAALNASLRSMCSIADASI